MKRLAFLFLLILSGCKVGPNYSPPLTFMPVEFVEDQPEKTTFVSDEDLIHWWEHTFNDPFLNRLLEETLLHNFDLSIAVERVYQARANYWIQFTALLPDFESDFQASRFRTSQSFATGVTPGTITPPAAATTALPPIRNFYQIGIDAIWQIDLFGKFRRIAQSAYYAWEAAIEDERGVKISVLSEVANLYVTICYFQTKMDLAKQLVEFDQGIVNMSQERFQSGLANEEEVAENLSTLQADTAALLVFETALKQSIYSLAVLLGRLPETLIEDFAINRPIPLASGKIPETLPCELLRRRPDIASAERSLASQTELIGAAVADLFPSVSLIGSSSSFAANPLQGANIGFSSDRISKLFDYPSRVWGIGALVTWPVFDFGKRCSAVDVQKFLSHQAYLTYEKTVIQALQEVETTLVSYFNEERRLDYITKQAAWDKRNLDLISDLFQAGLADYTQLLQAREKWLSSANSMVDSQKALDIDLIAIYIAIGGDW